MSTIREFLHATFYGNRLAAIIRILLGTMFIYSGFFKALDPVNFGNIIGMYNLLPDVLVPYVAIIMPYLELVLGILLVSGFMIRSSSFLSILLMALFSIAILINVIRGANFECGCFELSRLGISENIGWPLVFRDIILLLLFLLVFNVKRHTWSLESLLDEKRLRELK